MRHNARPDQTRQDDTRSETTSVGNARTERIRTGNTSTDNTNTGYTRIEGISVDNNDMGKTLADWKIIQWIRLLLAGYFELLLALPLLWLIPIYLIDDRVFWPWLASLAVFYVIGFGLRKLNPLSRLLTRHIVFLAIAFAYSWLMLDGWAAITIGTIVVWFACIRGSTYAMFEFREVLSTNICLIGIGLYFMVAVVAQYSPDLKPIGAPLSWIGLAVLVISLFVMNRNALDKESMQNDKKKSIGKTILWKNRILLVGFAVIVGLIAAFDMIRQAIISAFHAIGRWIAWLLSLGTDGEETIENPPASSPQDMLPMEPTEPSMFWVILETVAKWFVFILLAVAAIFIIYRLARLMPRLFKSLYQWLMSRFQLGDLSESDTGYEDEVVRLSDWGDLRKRWGDRIKSLFESEQRENWNKLKNNAERIRYLYRQTISRLVQEGYTYRASLTPRETKADATSWKSAKIASDIGQTSEAEVLPEELIRHYENVRYHNDVPSDRDVEALKSRLEQRNQNNKRD